MAAVKPERPLGNRGLVIAFLVIVLRQDLAILLGSILLPQLPQF